MVNGLSNKASTLQARIVSGSVILLAGSGLTTAVNLAYNVVIARYLGPGSFGHATVVYTLLTLLSAVTLSFQIVTAKVVAQQDSMEGKAAVYRSLHRSAWACGLMVALVLFLFRSGIAAYLNLPDSILVSLIAIGAAFYVPLGCRRGYFQGTCSFRRFAANLVLEGAVRLGGSLLLLVLGYGVNGVIAANAAAIAAAYLCIAPRLARQAPNPLGLWRAIVETAQAVSFFSGQVLINNCDIVLVKHLFPAREAGLYAAVAMVGRVIFSFSSAVVNTTFPLVAGTPKEERKGLRVISVSLLLVLGIGSVIALGLCLTPPTVWTSLFGSGFEIAGKYNLSYLQAIYALKTVAYSMSVVIITYEMSYKIANTTWVQLSFCAALILGILKYHSSLREVILVQLALMAGLFVCVTVPFLVAALFGSKELLQPGTGRPIRLIRRVSEDEVIAEFLKNDFQCPEFHEYREALQEIVIRPNVEDAGENAKRRALLFTRHLSLWAEIPDGTEWYEVQLNEMDLRRVRVFPRAQWRKLARGNFYIAEVVRSLRARRHRLQKSFLSKITSLAEQLTERHEGFGVAILIGVNEYEPLTVLDGNHRLVAAMVATPCGISKLRFMCGLSPRMTKCCWYNTNVATLFQYGKNMLVRAVRHPEAELARVLEDVG
ncbi:MAG: lipopolysaccharide biosynthesis protein [Terracidiphilus sp.]